MFFTMPKNPGDDVVVNTSIQLQKNYYEDSKYLVTAGDLVIPIGYIKNSWAALTDGDNKPVATKWLVRIVHGQNTFTRMSCKGFVRVNEIFVDRPRGVQTVEARIMATSVENPKGAPTIRAFI